MKEQKNSLKGYRENGICLLCPCIWYLFCATAELGTKHREWEQNLTDILSACMVNFRTQADTGNGNTSVEDLKLPLNLSEAHHCVIVIGVLRNLWLMQKNEPMGFQLLQSNLPIFPGLGLSLSIGYKWMPSWALLIFTSEFLGRVPAQYDRDSHKMGLRQIYTDHLRTGKNNKHLQAKKRGSRENQLYLHLDLIILTSSIVRKYNCPISLSLCVYLSLYLYLSVSITLGLIYLRMSLNLPCNPGWTWASGPPDLTSWALGS